MLAASINWISVRLRLGAILFGKENAMIGKQGMLRLLTGLLMILIVSGAHAAEGDASVEDDSAALETTDDNAVDGDVAVEPSENIAPATDAVASSPSAPTAPVNDHYPRFRFGFSAMGGPMIGTVKGGAGGLDARFGVQINNRISVYAQPMLAVGAGAAADEKSAEAQGLAVVGLGVLAEFTFLNMIYMGIGPQIIKGGIGTSKIEEDGVNSTAKAELESGNFFALAARAGLAIGSNNPLRLTKFTIGLDMHVVFHNNGASLMPMFALGFDMF